MKRSKYLLNVPFVIGLAVLVINDHMLKDVFGNMLTGKLSDFAGVFILPFVLLAFFRLKISHVLGITAAFFLWWKSGYSQVVIDAWNQLGLMTIGRVIDYTDYVAFIMLPLSAYVLARIDQFTFETKLADHRRRFTAILRPVLYGMTICSLLATSTDDDLPVTSDVETCCQEDPFSTSHEGFIGTGYYYVPTMFTPDGNGINDVFQVYVDAGIDRIDRMVIREIGPGSPIVFERENIVDIAADGNWDGAVNGNILTAQYNYEITMVSADSVTRIVHGRVCAIPCLPSHRVRTPVNVEFCVHPAQFDENTQRFMQELPSLEAFDCFEE